MSWPISGILSRGFRHISPPVCTYLDQHFCPAASVCVLLVLTRHVRQMFAKPGLQQDPPPSSCPGCRRCAAAALLRRSGIERECDRRLVVRPHDNSRRRRARHPRVVGESDPVRRRPGEPMPLGGDHVPRAKPTTGFFTSTCKYLARTTSWLTFLRGSSDGSLIIAFGRSSPIAVAECT